MNLTIKGGIALSLLILWDIEITVSSIQTMEPTFLTISFVTSPEEVGTPLISRQSRLIYNNKNNLTVLVHHKLTSFG